MRVALSYLPFTVKKLPFTEKAKNLVTFAYTFASYRKQHKITMQKTDYLQRKTLMK